MSDTLDPEGHELPAEALSIVIDDDAQPQQTPNAAGSGLGGPEAEAEHTLTPDELDDALADTLDELDHRP